MIETLFNQFMIFSLEKREELYKILIILLFLLFLIRQNQGKTFERIRKKQINKALDALSKKLRIRNEYRIPKEIEQKLYQNNFDKNSMMMFIANIMKHLGLPNAIPGIIINDASNRENSKPGSCTTYPDGYSNITINLLPGYNLEVIAAITIHECMHHYLNIKKIRFEDRIENEILTDTCAIYCGFTKYIHEGYKTRAKIYKGEYKLQKIGYLNQREIQYVIKQR